MITTGYIGGPQGNPAAQAIQFDETAAGVKYTNASIILTQPYWPVGYTAACRETFADQGMPYRCNVDACLVLPFAESNALVAAGAAKWS